MTPLLSTFSAGSVRGYCNNRQVGPSGQQLYGSGGSGTTNLYTFIVPTDVTSICVVCIGGGQGATGNAAGDGGGLAYKNNISVTPGESLDIGVGGGGGGTSFGSKNNGFDSYVKRSTTTLILATGGERGTLQVGDVTNVGGTGGSGFRAGGAGAAGYSGVGGNGGSAPSTNATNGAGGGGGGGGYGATDIGGSGGGGVGYNGEGANGTGGASGVGGGGGSSGDAGTSRTSGTNGGGGGAGGGGGGAGGVSGGVGFPGGLGVVRIIWGPNRSYPNNAANV